jgi:hypothetical protein
MKNRTEFCSKWWSPRWHQLCQKHWAPMWFVMGAGEEAEDHRLMNSNVNCTCPPPSLRYALHDRKRLGHYQVCLPSSASMTTQKLHLDCAMVWNIRKKTGLGHSPEHEGASCLPVELLRIMIVCQTKSRPKENQQPPVQLCFLLTYLPTHNPSYVLTTHLDFW